jgi:hypothetical protein
LVIIDLSIAKISEAGVTVSGQRKLIYDHPRFHLVKIRIQDGGRSCAFDPGNKQSIPGILNLHVKRIQLIK